MAAVVDGPRKLAIVGSYSDHDLYQRNRILVELFEALVPGSRRIRPEAERRSYGFSGSQSLVSRLAGVFRGATSIWTQRHRLRDVDTIFVPYPAYGDIFWLWLFGQLRGRRLIADAFLELHSTVVIDRGLLPPGSVRAWLLSVLQRFTLGKADLLLIDTAQQAQLLREKLGQCEIAVRVVPVGIDETLWTSLPAPALASRVRGRVLFWGTFIPLHGIDVILEAARILAQRGAAIDFHLIGDGQTAASIEQSLQDAPIDTLTWERGLVDSVALREALADADLVLGIFGSSVKAASVVPYKVHQALASNRPVITRRSPAVDPALDEAAGFIGCDAGDPEALADTIEKLWQRLQAGWQPATRALYDRCYGSDVLRQRLAAILDQRTVTT